MRTQITGALTLFLSLAATAQVSQRPATGISGEALRAPNMVASWPTVNAFWTGTAGTVLAHSGDAGVTWTSTTVPAANTISWSAGHGHWIAQDGNYVIIAYASGGSSTILTHVSDDGGATWNPPLSASGTQINDTGGGNQIQCLAVAGKFIVTWRSGVSVRLDEAPYSLTPAWGVDSVASANAGLTYRMAATPSYIGLLQWQGETQLRYRPFLGGSWAQQSFSSGMSSPNSARDLVALEDSAGTHFHALWMLGSTHTATNRDTATHSRFTIPLSGSTSWTNTAVSTYNSGVLGSSLRGMALAIASDNSVHAFVSSDAGTVGSPAEINHRRVWPTAGSTQSISGTTATLEEAEPVPFSADGAIGCVWTTELSPGSRDTIFNISFDNGGSWLPEPRNLAASGSTSIARTGSAVGTDGTIVTMFADPASTNTDILAQMLVGSSPLAQPGTGNPDSPTMTPVSLPVQRSSTQQVATFSVARPSCPPPAVPPLLSVGITFASFNSPIFAPAGPCNVLVDAGAGLIVLEGVVYMAGGTTTSVAINSGSGLNGAVINLQAARFGSSCSSNCFGIDISIGNALDFMILEI